MHKCYQTHQSLRKADRRRVGVAGGADRVRIAAKWIQGITPVAHPSPG